MLSSRDGLFLTGIRRIGKTTFLQLDLVPCLEEKDAVVIYVDLWANHESRSPTKAVLGSIARTLKSLSSPSKLKELKVDLKVLSFTFEAEDIGLENGVSIADALTELIEKIDRNIVLIIDEVQETLRTESGRNLLFALKAARDAVNLRRNNPSGTYLMIVGTGSHRSFVSAMASRSSLPFYGADRVDFPMLGADFIDWLIGQLPNKKNIPGKDALRKGFAMLGARPKVFSDVLKQFASYTGSEIDPAFLAVCANQARTDADEFLRPLREADRLTRVIFTEIAKAGSDGCRNLFSSAFLKEAAKAAGRSKPLRPSAIQAKLSAMQKKDWIFPVGYGSYAVSDPQAQAVWLANLEDYLDGDDDV
ncbi:hypothetical protein [uncultured Sutterella sp.]|uniref:hypothetical protein n=1 Tax=uncultured Sutterella sp. TaxID=286133 RepID=UPI00260287C8|nr:hypothetical protein [uncultured Sutterella sp.]